ncbi:MAG: VWA domain-containing protein [Candidatus Undinarchaeales archaeon]|jgi:hypothetical protein|nr:VWA domain-containing protein [Candidatus Undinarchaeales archaeon]MDP7493899.1 VWA domain-containing protein [Candidatus Undinarchaeales archaeon]
MALMRTAFSALTAERSELEERMPLVASISFEELSKARTVVSCQPVRCSGCGAVLTNPRHVKEDERLGVHWTCEYCSTVNIISKDEIPPGGGDDIDFVLDEPPDTKESPGSLPESKSVDTVAVIDTSGSMSFNKLDAVKQSLNETLADLRVNAPTSAFALITFDSTVAVHTLPGEAPVVLSGDVLRNSDQLIAQLVEMIDPRTLQPVGEMGERWTELVTSLPARGMTALGPAVNSALWLLKTRGGGRLVLLTDGMANVGLGTLTGPSSSGRDFYKRAARSAMDAGIVVDVVGMRDKSESNEMALDVIGELASSSGGGIYYVSAAEVEGSFRQIRGQEFLGHDVSLRLVTPRTLEVERITGPGAKADAAKTRLGAVTADREVFIRLKRSGKLEKKKVPLQAQIEYRDAQGRRHLRVSSINVDTIKDAKAYAKGYDTDIPTVMAMQEAGEEYFRNRTASSLDRLRAMKNNLATVASSAPIGKAQDTATKNLAFVEREIDRLSKAESEIRPKAAKASKRAVKGLSMQRMSVSQRHAEDDDCG